eukprot:1314523-Amorphochlora_amoeboformis.AAC.1
MKYPSVKRSAVMYDTAAWARKEGKSFRMGLEEFEPVRAGDKDREVISVGHGRKERESSDQHDINTTANAR